MPGTRFTDIRRFDSLDSTNRYLLDEARAGAGEGVVAVAEHQSAGRGRLGRRWEAPSGTNLLVSVLLRPPLPAEMRHLASAVVGLAAVDAAAPLGLELGLKWPNDILAGDGRKLAGVLAEADLTPDPAAGDRPTEGLSAPIVVGIGINVNWPATDADLPDDLVGAATSLRQQTGGPVDRSDLLEALLQALEPRVAALGSPSGRRGQADDLRARCTTIGTRVRVELADGRFEGLACDVTPEGHLVVETARTTRTVIAGDVVHVRPGEETTPAHPGAHRPTARIHPI
jgi:BirA family transcriptional regulator, biotin operon repressor / biotin---[acetyl-CoA-carboxylase] ligase